MNIHFANSEMLLLRIKTAFLRKQKFTFLLGAGLTRSQKDGEPGVSDVSEIIEAIKKIFKDAGQSTLLEAELKNTLLGNPYQVAMRTLLNCFGQDQLNEVIVKAVLKARIKNEIPILKSQELNSEEIENDLGNWYLNQALRSLAKIFVEHHSAFAGPLLTSNFDPLIEVSIKNQNGHPQSIFLVNDGKFSNSLSNNIHQVLHFHGFWRGDDTLHTPEQLTRSRPQLKGDLKKLLAGNLLIISSYGGWQDVFTKTLFELIEEGTNNFNVLWCFYEKDAKKIIEQNTPLLQRLYPSIGQRLVLYNGIDLTELLPRLQMQINQAKEGTISETPVLPDEIMKSSYIIEAKKIYRCDNPPSNLYWVGRNEELKLLRGNEFKTFFVTGIGGQGKSGLVSYYIHQLLDTSEYEFWDWRDCKEEDNRIHTIIIAIIERLTNGKIRSFHINNETIGTLIDLLFECLGDRKILFVFDNVDNYIDYERFYPSRGVATLFEYANTKEHNSKFIFTCRPSIKATFTKYLEIPLRELTIPETIQLFKKYNLPVAEEELIEIAREAHSVTNGHALWINLIAAQAKRGKDTAKQFIAEVKQHNTSTTENPSYVLAENTLSVVWKSLNLKQQTLLRGMAEMVTAVSEENIQDIISSELNLNQFGKAFRALKGLNLIVIRTSESKEMYELHPLVKEFVLNKYKRNERSKFITLVVNFYDQIILIIKPKLSVDSPFSYFENWLHKIELQINKGDYKDALIATQDIASSILSAGHYEAFLRIAMRLFLELDWLKAVAEEWQYFHAVLYKFVHTLIDFGRFDEADAHLKKYARTIEGKGLQYIHLCNLYSYYYWSNENYKVAIEWSERALELENSTGVSIKIDLRNNLALALRDTLDKKNIERALSIFLKGENLGNVLTDNSASENFTGSFFGNIGRCLWFLEDYTNALICYKKSLYILSSEKQENTIVNQGYAYLWIAQCCKKNTDNSSAEIFYKKAIQIWNGSAPTKSMKTKNEYQDFCKNEKIIQTEMSEWEIDKFCNEFLRLPRSS